MSARLRVTACAIVVIVALAISAALILQHVFYLEPCPLCIAQRIMFVLAAIAVIPIVLLGSIRATLLAIPFALLALVSGWLLAARHVWITHYPPEDIPGCLPGFEYLFDTLALSEAFSYLVVGTADCLEDTWSLLGLSIPEYSLLLFSILLIMTLDLLHVVLRLNRTDLNVAVHKPAITD